VCSCGFPVLASGDGKHAAWLDKKAVELVYVKEGTCFIQTGKKFLQIKPVTGNRLYALVLDGLEAPIPLHKQQVSPTAPTLLCTDLHPVFLSPL
jgi:hypothetical protein